MIEIYVKHKFLTQTFDIKSSSYLPCNSFLHKYVLKGAKLTYIPLKNKGELLIQAVIMEGKVFYLLAARLTSSCRVFMSAYRSMFVQFGMVKGKANCTLCGLGDFEVKEKESNVAYLGGGEEHFIDLESGEHLIPLHSVSDEEMAVAAKEVNVFHFMKHQADTGTRFSVRQQLTSNILFPFFTWVSAADFSQLSRLQELKVHLADSFKQFVKLRSEELGEFKFDVVKIDKAIGVRTLIQANAALDLSQIVEICSLQDYANLNELLYLLIGQTGKAYRTELILQQMFELGMSGEVSSKYACSILGRSRSAAEKAFKSRFQISYSNLMKWAVKQK